MSEQGLQTDPTGSDTPTAAADVVTTRRGPPGGGHVLQSKRRRRRWLALFLTLWAVVAGLMGYAWYQYGKISNDLQVSNGRVAAPVQKALTPAPAGAARQTTIVAGIDSHRNVAGTVILARTDSTRHAVEILTVPSTVSLTSSQSLRDVLRFDGVPRAIRLLQHDLRVPVNHVLLLQLSQAGSIVRSLGGITVTNPSPVPYAVTGGHGVFPAGRLKLTGRTAQWYLDPTERPLTPAIAAAGEVRQAAVVRGVTDKLVHLTTPSAINGVAHTISRNFATDLSPDPVLGIVAARLGAHALIDCRLPAGANLAAARAIPTVAGFETAAPKGRCTTEPLKTKLPAAAVAATIIATIVTHGGTVAFYWAVVLAIAIWAFGAIAWILMLPLVRGVRGMPRSRPVVVAAAAHAPPSVQRARRVRRRRALPRLPRLSRPALPHFNRVALPHIELPELPRVALPGLPHISRPELPELRRNGGRSRRRRFGPHLFVRIVSVPVSLGLGMLIAHFLY